MRKVTLTAMVLCVSAALLSAQSHPQEMKAEEQKAVIHILIENLNRDYIFPDITAKYVKMLRKNLRSGKYRKLGNPEEFAAAVNRDLAAVHEDRHLNIRFDPLWVQNKRGREKLDEAAIKRRERADQRNNYGFKEIRILPGNIGYLKFDSFSYRPEAYPVAIGAMSVLRNVDALIIDLRRNGGGAPEMVQFLCSYFLKNPRQHLNSFYYNKKEKLTQYWTYTYLPGKRLETPDLYILTSGRTFSAAEEFAYNLKHLKRATIVGERTGGGAHDNKMVVLTDRFYMSLPFARAYNPVTHSNWELKGVEPDVKTTDREALDTAKMLAVQKLMEKAEEPAAKKYYSWLLDYSRRLMDPFVFDKDQLQLYVGTYGPRKITLQGEALFYQRGEGPKMKMIPFAEDCFIFSELDYFRIRFLREGGRIVALEGYTVDGPTDRHQKE